MDAESAVWWFRQYSWMVEDAVSRVLARYERWLGEQRLAAGTRRSYRRWVVELLGDLAAEDPQLGLLSGRRASVAREREAALRDWRRRLSLTSTTNRSVPHITQLLNERG